MLIHRTRSAGEVVRLAGRLPSAVTAATLAALLALPSSLLAQPAPGAPPATPGQPEIRNPLQPGTKGGEEPRVKVSDKGIVDVQVKDQDIASVLELLSIQSQKNIIASKSVSGRVSATLYGVTFYEALDSILHVNGFGYIEKGNFIYVYTLDELEKIQKALNKRVAKVIRLNYLSANDAADFVKPLLSMDGGQIQKNATTGVFTLPADTPAGKDDFALSATLVVIDYEENIKAIEALVKELDTRPAQVLVEATILQSSLSESNAFGVDFAIIGNLNFTDFITAGGPLAAANALVKGGTGASGQGVSPPDNVGRAIVSNPGETGGPSTFKVGIIKDDLAVFLKMLDQVTDTVILSNPKVLTLNRMPARVLVGRRVGYLSTTATETSTTQTVEFLDTGTQLYVRPFVSNDGEIRMELVPKVSEAIVRQSTNAQGAAVSIPDEVTQGVTTNVIVRDGQTIVLGGLFRESTQFGRTQVPFVGDIPFLGTAFRGHTDDTARAEIIFMITPTIVTDAGLNEAAARAAADVDHLRTGARQGLLPWSRERMTSALNLEAEHLAQKGDYEMALWDLRRSLSLYPAQPDALRLRERITGQRESWPDRAMINEMVDTDIARRIQAISPPPAGTTRSTKQPYGWKKVPMSPVEPPKPGAPRSDAEPSAEPEPASPQTDASADQPLSHGAPSTPDSTGEMAETPPAMPDATVVMTPDIDMAPLADDTPPVVTTSEPPPVIDFIPEMPPVAPEMPAVAAAPTEPITARELSPAERQAQEATLDALASVRESIRNYRAMTNNALPPVGVGPERVTGWEDFVQANIVKEPPVNAWVGGDHGSFVLIVKGRTTPDTAFPTDYGWIFNADTGQLWAAGFDATGRPVSRPGAAPTAGATEPDTAPQASAEKRSGVPFGGLLTALRAWHAASMAHSPQRQTPNVVGVEADKEGK